MGHHISNVAFAIPPLAKRRRMGHPDYCECKLGQPTRKIQRDTISITSHKPTEGLNGANAPHPRWLGIED
jgi:hypothetical protein